MPRFEKEKHSRGYRIAVSGAKYLLRIFLLALFAVLVIYAARRLYALGYEAFSATAVDEKNPVDIEVTIVPDMTSVQIANLLNSKGLIRESTEAYILQEYVYGYRNKLIPGTYVLNTSQTIDEMLEVMSTPAEEEEQD